MIDWLTGTVLGKFISTFFISMVPVVELRLGLPYGIAQGLGILMPMSSLPSPYGIGTMGKSAYQFVDFLKASGQSYWQLLPLGPTSFGDSPYSSFSTFAGSPYYIDLDLLCKDKLLKKSEITGRDWGSDPAHADYAKVFAGRFR